MGVSYNAIGGIGVLLDENIISALIKDGNFTEEEWGEDNNSCLEELEVEYEEAGSYGYGGEKRFYLLVKGKTLEDVNKNKHVLKIFLEKLKINITDADLIVVCDLHVW